MIRALLFFAALCAVALGINWLADRPGEIMLSWQGYEYRVSLLVGLAVLLAAAVVLTLAWSLLRLLVRLPRRIAATKRARRRTRGYLALTRGVVAVGAGDSAGATRHAREAETLLEDEPLALFLKAQAAQLAGDRATAEASFNDMLAIPETRVLGLRGLHVEARRRGDAAAAHQYASEAQKIAPLPWAGHAVLDHHAVNGNWAAALAAVERNAAGKIIDKATADRQRAVLKTAMALEKAEREPEAALALARDAVKLAPGLIPATVLAATLMTRFGDLRKAIRLLETAWKLCPHPDLAAAYLNVRPGDSARDRLVRAHALGDLALDHAEGRLTIARAALEARDVDLARKVMGPLFQAEQPFGRPTVRSCLLMADLEEVAGNPGRAREWLARASRGARDACWIADGVVSDRWSPVSPATGRLDAFRWQQPSEQVSGPAPAPFPVVAEADLGEVAEPSAPRIAPPEPPMPDAEAADAALPPAPPQARADAAPPAAARPVVFTLSLAPDDPGPDLGVRRSR